MVKPNFRPVFFWSDAAEANYLLRQKQHLFDINNVEIGKVLVANKLKNQLSVLKKTRKKDILTENAKAALNKYLMMIPETKDYAQLMGVEGVASKVYFTTYFQDLDWNTRRPRIKCDELNATLDIGYTILFNYVECFLRMFGFDLYVGVFHRLWFKRKSLVCDMIEPFRCIIDRTIRTAYHRKQFLKSDFKNIKGEYRLKNERNGDYMKVFFDALILYKTEIFNYVQSYYRCFMSGKQFNEYPYFEM